MYSFAHLFQSAKAIQPDEGGQNDTVIRVSEQAKSESFYHGITWKQKAIETAGQAEEVIGVSFKYSSGRPARPRSTHTSSHFLEFPAVGDTTSDGGDPVSRRDTQIPRSQELSVEDDPSECTKASTSWILRCVAC
jgi:hypothetical protein